MERLFAGISSQYDGTDALFPPGNVIDGKLYTVDDPSLCASAEEDNAWIYVRVPPATPVGYVLVHNRGDDPSYAAWLSPYEIWVGATAPNSPAGPAATGAVRCGDGARTAGALLLQDGGGWYASLPLPPRHKPCTRPRTPRRAIAGMRLQDIEGAAPH